MSHQEPTLGRNRTGSQMSPVMSGNPCTYVLLESPHDVTSTRSVARLSDHDVILIIVVAFPLPDVDIMIRPSLP